MTLRQTLAALLSARRASRGVALLEAAITIPVLLLFIGGAVDLGSMMVRYVAASRFSYEGARFVAQVTGTKVTVDDNGDATSLTCSSTDTTMGQMCTRIKYLMDNSNFKSDEEAAGISLLVLPLANCSQSNGQPVASTVQVTVALNWKPTLLKFLNVDKVRATTTAPYLVSTERAQGNCTYQALTQGASSSGQSSSASIIGTDQTANIAGPADEF